MGEGEARDPRQKSVFRDILETLLLAAILFAVLRLLVQNFRVEGHSMDPTLQDGEFLMVDKVSYELGDISRGDIIVFHAPTAPGKDFIKRVIGLPGEEVEVREGTVFIDGQLLEEPYIPDAGTRSWGPAVVGADELYVLGDNRPSSNDSRNWGMLSQQAVVGKAWFAYWPPSAWGLLPHATYPADSSS